MSRFGHAQIEVAAPNEAATAAFLVSVGVPTKGAASLIGTHPAFDLVDRIVMAVEDGLAHVIVGIAVGAISAIGTASR
jgi:hypothetical protein